MRDPWTFEYCGRAQKLIGFTRGKLGVTKVSKRESVGKHIYLRDRVDGWAAGLDLALWLSATGVAVLVAAYSPDGFWIALLEALKQLLNRV